MTEIHDLAAPYALDALDGDERGRFEAHLAGCPECQDTLEELNAGVMGLVGIVAEQPPEHVRTAVLEAVAITPQEAVVMDLAEYRRNRRTTIVLGAVAAILAVIATVAAVLSATGDPADAILAATDVTTVEMTGPAGSGRFTYSVQVGQGVFVSDSLPDVAEGRTYQMWLIDSAGPSPAGVFAPEGDGRSRAVVDGVTNGVTVGITEEPAGGSAQPTGQVLLAGEL